MKTINRIFFLLTITAGLSGLAPAEAQTPAQYNIAAGSKVWFDGTSTLHAFGAASSSVIGTIVATHSGRHAASSVHNDSLCQANVTIPARSLDSGEKGLNDNMYDAMKADKFPDIKYNLVSAEFNPEADTAKGEIALKTTGELTIAGVVKEIQMDASIEAKADGRLELTGSEPILMTDFGISPPTMMFGVIKTGDKVVVHFDLILSPLQNSALSAR